MRKWYSLIDKVYSISNLEKSFVKVKKNKGSKTSGADKINVKEYELHLEGNLCQLQRELKSGNYQPQAVKRVYIDKPDGSKRPLGIPTIKDRIVQQSPLNVLQPIFEPDFHPSSYGYRPKCSAQHAVAKAENYLEKRLKLTVNRTKTYLTDLEKGISYLGFVITNYGVVVAHKSIKKFKEKVRKLTPRRKGKSIYYYFKELSMLLRGFSNYFRIALSKGLFAKLMSWIRRRLRMMIMRAWKTWKPLHKQLRRNGYKGNFKKISMTRWRNSNSPLVDMALPNKWFEEKGLYNMERVVTNTLHQYYEFALNKI